MSRLASTPGAAFPFYSQKQSFAAAEDPAAGNPELKTSSLWANKFLMEAAAPEGTALPLAHPQPGTRPRVCVCVCVCVCVRACTCGVFARVCLHMCGTCVRACAHVWCVCTCVPVCARVCVCTRVVCVCIMHVRMCGVCACGCGCGCSWHSPPGPDHAQHSWWLCLIPSAVCLSRGFWTDAQQGLGTASAGPHWKAGGTQPWLGKQDPADPNCGCTWLWPCCWSTPPKVSVTARTRKPFLTPQPPAPCSYI